ncbi:hypothetical protein CDV36_008631 [Fusarium kuroshium]|uniref:Uncharacterized protein n=1 Tax=Fusarium kuroshium TaxID=2010991 RepID=A0A3M2S2G5_9HYPO|nr:hypothetical protein CDV36_008631 [Fusarium kuroshium]
MTPLEQTASGPKMDPGHSFTKMSIQIPSPQKAPVEPSHTPTKPESHGIPELTLTTPEGQTHSIADAPAWRPVGYDPEAQ